MPASVPPAELVTWTVWIAGSVPFWVALNVRLAGLTLIRGRGVTVTFTLLVTLLDPLEAVAVTVAVP
jgi:hypothetical protein